MQKIEISNDVCGIKTSVSNYRPDTEGILITITFQNMDTLVFSHEREIEHNENAFTCIGVSVNEITQLKDALLSICSDIEKMQSII